MQFWSDTNLDCSGFEWQVLFSVVKDRMEHPQINNDVMFAIDSFMNDDLSDDTDDIPF